jgi:hypothetical protein
MNKKYMIYSTFSNFVVNKVRVCLDEPIAVVFQILLVSEKRYFIKEELFNLI